MRVIKWTTTLFISIALLFAGFYLGVIVTRNPARVATLVVDSGLDSLFTFEILGERYDILFEKERVLFQVFETSGKNDFIAFTFTKNDYPKLFEQGSAKSSFYTATVVGDKRKPMIEVANNYSDHGGFSPAYTLIVDPTSGKATVKE